MNQCCENCRYAGGHSYSHDCRRHSPIGVIEQAYGRAELKAHWPPVRADYWCGDWMAKPPEPKADDAP